MADPFQAASAEPTGSVSTRSRAAFAVLQERLSSGSLASLGLALLISPCPRPTSSVTGTYASPAGRHPRLRGAAELGHDAPVCAFSDTDPCTVATRRPDGRALLSPPLLGREASGSLHRQEVKRRRLAEVASVRRDTSPQLSFLLARFRARVSALPRRDQAATQLAVPGIGPSCAASLVAGSGLPRGSLAFHPRLPGYSGALHQLDDA